MSVKDKCRNQGAQCSGCCWLEGLQRRWEVIFTGLTGKAEHRTSPVWASGNQKRLMTRMEL